MTKIDDLDQKITNLEGQMAMLSAQLETLNEAQVTQKENLETFQTETEQAQDNMEQRLSRVGEKIEINKTAQQEKNETFETGIQQQTMLLAQNQQMHTIMVGGMAGGAVLICLLGVTALIRLNSLCGQISNVREELSQVEGKLNELCRKNERKQKEETSTAKKAQEAEQKQNVQVEQPHQEKDEIRPEEVLQSAQSVNPVEMRPDHKIPDEVEKLLKATQDALLEANSLPARDVYNKVKQSVSNVQWVSRQNRLDRDDGYTYVNFSQVSNVLMGIKANDEKMYIVPAYFSTKELRELFEINGEKRKLVRSAVAQETEKGWRLESKGEID